MGLEEDVAWFDQVVFTGLVISWRNTHWSIVLKGQKDGRSLVSFLRADTWEDVWETLTAASKNGWLEWKHDKYK